MTAATTTATMAHSSQAGKYAPAIVSVGAPPQPVEENACPNSSAEETSRIGWVKRDPRCTGHQCLKDRCRSLDSEAIVQNKLTRDSTVCNSAGHLGFCSQHCGQFCKLWGGSIHTKANLSTLSL